MSVVDQAVRLRQHVVYPDALARELYRKIDWAISHQTPDAVNAYAQAFSYAVAGLPLDEALAQIDQEKATHPGCDVYYDNARLQIREPVVNDVADAHIGDKVIAESAERAAEIRRSGRVRKTETRIVGDA